MYILIIIILLIILIISTLLIKKNYPPNIESYKAPSSIPPNYMKYNTELTNISNNNSGEPLAFDPTKNNYNYTQIYYAFLVQLFQTLSKFKINFNKKLALNYAKNTIDYNAMDKLRILMDSFLAKIRELAPQTDFWVTGYESWRIYQDKDSPLKINQIDCFIYDRVNWTQVRLLLEIIEMPTKESMGKYECRHINDKSLQTCAKETTPEFPTYPVGYPVNNQLIELPTETITSGNQVANYKGINFPIPCPFEKLWINWVEIVNSSLVLNAFENYPDKQLEGIYNIPFDHSEYKLKGKYFPYQDINRVTNQWPTINTQPKGVEPWPCTPVPFVWDSQGVRPEVKPTRTCPGKRTSLFETELTASYDPSMFNYPRGVTDYTWLFANTNKDMGLAYEGY